MHNGLDASGAVFHIDKIRWLHVSELELYSEQQNRLIDMPLRDRSVPRPVQVQDQDQKSGPF